MPTAEIEKPFLYFTPFMDIFIWVNDDPVIMNGQDAALMQTVKNTILWSSPFIAVPSQLPPHKLPLDPAFGEIVFTISG